MNNMKSFPSTVYIVTWEWDGVKPPGTFYRRMAQAGYVIGRGTGKVLSPAKRRTNKLAKDSNGERHDGAHLAFQEGVFITSIESVASYVRNLAVDFGASNVYFLNGWPRDGYSRKMEDLEAINRVENVAGHRGPLPKAKDWIVSCKECLQCGHIKAYSPTKCVHCPGLYILSRPGIPELHSDPGGPIVEAWVRSRFRGTHWEPVKWGSGGTTPPHLKPVDNMQITGRDKEILNLILANPPDDIEQFDREEAIRLLDAAYVGVRYSDSKERLHARSMVAMHYFRLGGQPGKFPFVTPAGVDVVDAGMKLDPEKVALMMYHKISGG